MDAIRAGLGSQDKTTAVSEKANLERELKRERSKAGTLSDKLGKREEVEGRKRGALAAEAAAVREELKASEAAVAELKAAAASAQQATEELQAAVEAKEALVASLEADKEALGAELEHARSALAAAEQREGVLASEVSRCAQSPRGGLPRCTVGWYPVPRMAQWLNSCSHWQAEDGAQQRQQLEVRVTELQVETDRLRASIGELERGADEAAAAAAAQTSAMEVLQGELEAQRSGRAAAEAELARIDELSLALEEAQAKLGESEKAAAVTETELGAQKARGEELTRQLQASEAAAVELRQQLETALQEKSHASGGWRPMAVSQLDSPPPPPLHTQLSDIQLRACHVIACGSLKVA